MVAASNLRSGSLGWLGGFTKKKFFLRAENFILKKAIRWRDGSKLYMGGMASERNSFF